MAFQSEQLKDRTRQFAIRVIRELRSLPANNETLVLTRQLLRSVTSVAANYRAVCRSRSKAEFVSKIGVVVEEADKLCSGWKCSLILDCFHQRKRSHFSKKQTRYWQSLRHPNELRKQTGNDQMIH